MRRPPLQCTGKTTCTHLPHQKFQIPPQLIDCLEGGNFASKPGSWKKEIYQLPLTLRHGLIYCNCRCLQIGKFPSLHLPSVRIKSYLPRVKIYCPVYPSPYLVILPWQFASKHLYSWMEKDCENNLRNKTQLFRLRYRLTSTMPCMILLKLTVLKIDRHLTFYYYL